mmetsp:Transcript_40939/g.96077  ORF Transcript_40939/g.96077 Transcript_40939/m.96077 type:complete len:371 (-) Transcript_40939:411-1523(-)
MYLFDPLPRVFASINEISLGRPLSRLMIIFPPSCLRKAHQNTFNPPTSLQPEHSSPVVNKVELHISPATHQLPLFLLWCESIILMFSNDGPVRVDDIVKALFTEFKDGVRVPVVEIIKENTAKTTCLATMFDLEIPVRPSLELWVKFFIMVVADLLQGSMEMIHVVLVHIGRGDVRSAAEPPNSPVGFKIPIVEVHRGTHRILRMHDRRQPAGEERNSLPGRHALGPIHSPLGGRLQGLLRHGSIHDRQVDASLLEYGSVFEDAAHTAATVSADPGVLLEGGLAVYFGDGLRDFDLGLAAEFFELSAHWVVTLGTVLFANETFGDGIHGFMRVPSKIYSRSVRRLLALRCLFCSRKNQQLTLKLNRPHRS